MGSRVVVVARRSRSASSRRLHSSGVRDPYAKPAIEAVLPPRLEAVIRDSGAVFRLKAERDLQKLRILDVAVAVCTASMVTHPNIVADVHEALQEHDGHWWQFPACGDLVRTAKWALARHQSGGDLG